VIGGILRYEQREAPFSGPYLFTFFPGEGQSLALKTVWNFCPGSKLSHSLAYFAGQKSHSSLRFQQFTNVWREQS
jgi:hypothetical protein